MFPSSQHAINLSCWSHVQAWHVFVVCSATLEALSAWFQIFEQANPASRWNKWPSAVLHSCGSIWLNPSVYILPCIFPENWSLSHEFSPLEDDERRGKTVVIGLTQDSKDSSVGRRWVINDRSEGNWGNISLKSTQEGTCIKCPKLHLYRLNFDCLKDFGMTMNVMCYFFVSLIRKHIIGKEIPQLIQWWWVEWDVQEPSWHWISVCTTANT